MASTNHTTNYQLSQFVQTDKPAWLGDYNQDMTKIDAQMKVNADAVSTVATTVAGQTTAISGLTSDVATAQGDITALGTRVTAVETKNTEQDTAISNAQTTATTANGKADTNAENIASQGLAISSLQTDDEAHSTAIAGLTTNLNNFEQQTNANFQSFNLTDFTTQTSAQLVANYSGLSVYNQGTSCTLAQSSDSKCFKFYGSFSLYRGSSSTTTISKTAITGLSGYYGIKTSLHLNVAPQEAYVIIGAGMSSTWNYGTTQKLSGQNYTNIAVGTDGYIYLFPNTSNSLQFSGYDNMMPCYMANLYFNASFGDTPPSE